MKKLILTVLSFIAILTVSGQYTFEKTFDYWSIGEGHVVYAEHDGYILAGGAGRNLQNFLFIMKTDLYGDTLWVKEYDFGYLDFNYLWLRAHVTDQAGNKYFGLDCTGDSANLVKFDSEWNLIWKKKLDDNYIIYRMAMTQDGNIIAVGGDQPFSYYMLKLNQDGELLWRSDYIEFNVYESMFFPLLAELPDSTIVVCANWYSSPYYASPSRLFTFSSSGDSLSSVYLNTPSSFNTIFHSQLTGDEFISLCIKPNNFNPSYLIRHKADGTILSETDLHNEDPIDKFLIKSNNTIVTCGIKDEAKQNFLYLNSYSLTGDSLWSSTLVSEKDLSIFSMKLLDDNGLLLGGFIHSNACPEGAPYLVRTDSLGKISPVGFYEGDIVTARVYPNPVSASVVFETPEVKSGNLVIYDATGRQCETKQLTPPKTIIDTHNLKSGIYLYNIIANKQITSGKFLISAKR